MAVRKETLRERLEQERERILGEIDALEYLHADGLGTTTEYEHYGNHMADIATETFEQEKGLGLELNLRRLLQQTDDALRRLDDGNYGVCANCGEPIPPERLEVLPQATLCVRCKKLQEARR